MWLGHSWPYARQIILRPWRGAIRKMAVGTRSWSEASREIRLLQPDSIRICGASRGPHSGRVLRRGIPALVLAAALSAISLAEETPAPMGDASLGGRCAQVTVEPTKTSIYIGNVSLTMPPFVRRAGVYSSDYRAKVFPFFFYGERGSISIEFPDENLRQLLRGETVYFKGSARNSNGVGRRIEGRAIPDPSSADHGKIKVRVWVGKIELIFNTVYRFTGTD